MKNRQLGWAVRGAAKTAHVIPRLGRRVPLCGFAVPSWWPEKEREWHAAAPERKRCGACLRRLRDGW